MIVIICHPKTYYRPSRATIVYISVPTRIATQDPPHAHKPFMSAPSLTQFITKRPWLKRWMTPLAHWYADAAGYRKLGLRYYFYIIILPIAIHPPLFAPPKPFQISFFIPACPVIHSFNCRPSRTTFIYCTYIYFL